MSKLKDRLDKARREGIPREPRAEPPKAEAKVIPYPKGTALVVAKSERTTAEEVDRALERERAAEEERFARAQRLVESAAFHQAAERFNAAQERERSEAWFDPRYPGGFRP